MKRIVTIQDISCVGKCSLTVALPIISAMSVECAIIPTAVLSTHTAFKGFTFRDLTSDIKDIVNHWKKEDLKFDAMYTGYLGSFEQIEIMEWLFDELKTNSNHIIVDPAMADHGKFYVGFDTSFAKRMAKLCSKADIAVPNITEATFMLDMPYIESGYDRKYIEDILQGLHKLGVKYPVLTGVSFDESKLGVMAYLSDKDEYFEYYNDKLPVALHGTGDIFASTFTGAYVNGKGLEESLRIAADYVCESIKCNLEDENPIWYGANFEEAMPYLINRIK
ncbi:MAG: pyridoxamine kinase [Erysipelotrichaceae bacterium]|nr:pyridoxamine kinase [Erysipelotrichaceae bacterium]